MKKLIVLMLVSTSCISLMGMQKKQKSIIPLAVSNNITIDDGSSASKIEVSPIPTEPSIPASSEVHITKEKHSLSKKVGACLCGLPLAIITDLACCPAAFGHMIYTACRKEKDPNNYVLHFTHKINKYLHDEPQ